jgi:hypothetical protein
MMTLLRKIFKFKEISELPMSKRKSILEDFQVSNNISHIGELRVNDGSVDNDEENPTTGESRTHN